MNARQMHDRSLRVLLVDDNEPLRENLVECLEAVGHEVTQACDGVEALARLAQQRPDVVVLDLIMPRLDGRALAAAVRRDPLLHGLRLVLMTGHAASEIHTCPDVDAVLEKPFELDALLSAIRARA
jgi:chemosensory pili system protein ChpA (sensor histidine kinase/response regulator)